MATVSKHLSKSRHENKSDETIFLTLKNFYVVIHKTETHHKKRGDQLLMRVLLELLRIIIILGLLGGVIWTVIENIYTLNAATERYSWLGMIAIFILLFVLYRNKLQFSGWYTGKGKKRLPKNVSYSLIIISILLMGSPFILNSLFN